MAETSVVCGGGGALGGAIVEALLARGDEVVVVDRHADGEPVERVRREAVDLTSADAVEELWSRLAADGVAPRWVVNAVGGLPRRPGLRVGARCTALRRRPEPRHGLVVVPLGGAAPSGGRRDRERQLALGRLGRGRVGGVLRLEGRRQPAHRGARGRARRAPRPCECGHALGDRHAGQPRVALGRRRSSRRSPRRTSPR